MSYSQMRNWQSDDSNEILIKIGIVAGSLAAMCLFFWFISHSADKLSKVIVHNTGFWIMIFIALVYGVFRKFTNRGRFAWAELPLQLAVSFLTIGALYALFYSTSANLTDTEVWNGWASRAEYYEAWTEEVTYTEQEACGTDKDGNTIYQTVTKTREDYHGPEWKVQTTVGDFSTDENIYRAYVARFGKEKKEDLHRLNQVSFGDGNMYLVSHNGAKDDRLVPASREHFFINYLRASDSIRKVSGAVSGFQELLRPYPRVHAGVYGPIVFDRVIDANVNAPAAWKQTVNQILDQALTRLGSDFQVNILVYLAKTSDAQFGYALEEAWVKGKKNDVIVVIGANNFPALDFVHVMAWTKVEEFPITLRNRLRELADISDAAALADIIVDQIKQPPQQGGFVRLPMADLEYLIADIKLPWWCQVLIVIIGGAVSWFTSLLLIENDLTE